MAWTFNPFTGKFDYFNKGLDDKVKVTTNDTTPGFLADKLILATDPGLETVLVNPSGNENLRLKLAIETLNAAASLEDQDEMAIYKEADGTNEKVTLVDAKFYFVPEIKSGTVTLPGNGAINLETINLSNGSPYKLFLRIYSDDFEVYRTMEITLTKTEFNAYDFVVDNLQQNSNFDVQFQPTGIISNVSLFIQSNYSREVTVSYVRIFHA